MKPIIISLALLTAFATCTTTKQISTMKASPPSSDVPGIIYRYVSEHKGWKAKEYTIKKDRLQDGCIVYTIRYLADAKIPFPGGGQSIELYYDPSKHTIVRELGFQ